MSCCSKSCRSMERSPVTKSKRASGVESRVLGAHVALIGPSDSVTFGIRRLLSSRSSGYRRYRYVE